MDSAEDQRKCLAFDAGTAVNSVDIRVLVWKRTKTTATEVFPTEDMDLLHKLLQSQGQRSVAGMTAGQAPDFRTVVIDLVRLVGSHTAGPTL